MIELKRESPVNFTVNTVKTEERNNWTVALEYENEGQGPWLADLSHKIRWDLQDRQVGAQTPCDLAVPQIPGECDFGNNTLVNRMNRTQVSIYHLGESAPAMPNFAGYTDVTEATVFIAVFGPKAFQIAEKLTNLDFMDPSKQAPFLLQGPFSHVPCQIVTLEKSADGSGGFLLTCGRGYGDCMVKAIFKAGMEFDIRPCGEERFNNWTKKLK